MKNIVITNARLVLIDRVVEGTLVAQGQSITDISEGNSHLPSAFDCEGDYLIPGMIELHTDNVERHIRPRHNTFWPPDAAIMGHDREIAAAGITTVFDSLCVGIRERAIPVDFLDAIHRIADMPENMGFLKADHYFHWRCEVPSAHVLEQLSTMLHYSRLKMLSVMDHTPGQRQFSDLDRYANYHRGLFRLNDDQMSGFIIDRIADHKANSASHRAAVVALAREHGLKLASHDDATAEHVEDAVRDGMAVAEFPTTIEAARASHAGGIRVMMGAPNVVRGSSHTGNVSAAELGAQGVLDILSSDYLPSSMLYGATLLAERSDNITLPQAIATVTSTPARAVGLEDRGELAVGLRADMVRFRMIEGAPIIRDVWRGGVKVA